MNPRFLRVGVTAVMVTCFLVVAASPAFAAATIANQKLRRSGTTTWKDGPLALSPGQRADFNCAAGGGSGVNYQCAWKSCITHAVGTETIYTDSWAKATSSSARYIPGTRTPKRGHTPRSSRFSTRLEAPRPRASR